MKTQGFKILPVVILASAIIVQGCNSDPKKSDAGSMTAGHQMAHSAPTTDSTDNMKNGTAVNRFLEEAAISGLVEVQMGKLGEEKASLKSIKDFAATIVKDHTAANAELKALAEKKGFTVPAELSEVKQEHLNDLKRAMGKDFDNYYINMMVEDHISDIALFEGASKSPDTDVSAFAKKTLPVLQKHYNESREISKLFDQNMGRK